MTGVRIKRGNVNRHTHAGRTPCGDCSYAATTQEPQKLREAAPDAALAPAEGHGPTDGLLLDSSLQRRETKNFCCLNHSGCGTLLMQP